MKNKISFILIVGISAALILNACKKEKAKAVVSASNVADTCATITFSKTISPMVVNYCATGSGCHGNGSSHVVFTNYSSIQAEVANGKLSYTSSPAAIMGKTSDMSASAGLTNSQTNQFICWLKSGAPNN